MKVIVAGLPKTGTKSMNAALTHLGYSVYDAPENFALLYEDYKKIFRDGWTTEDFKRMYENVDAIVDVPACYFWEEIHRAFPDAKIILTTRESEDVWFESLKNQIETEESFVMFRLLTIFSPTFRRIMTDVGYVLWSVVFGVKRSRWRRTRHLNSSMLKLKYRAHNAHVLQNAPDDKLLVYNCAQGWGPLCKFLSVETPDEPFPHKNVRGKWAQETLRDSPMVRKLRGEVKVTCATLVFALGTVGGFFLYKHGIIRM